MSQIEIDLGFAQAMRYVNAEKWELAAKMFSRIGNLGMAQWAHFKLSH